MGLLIPFEFRENPNEFSVEEEETEILSNKHKMLLRKRLQQIAKLVTLKDMPRIFHDTPVKLASIKSSQKYVTKMESRIKLLHQMLFDKGFSKSKGTEKLIAAGLMYFINSKDFFSDDIPGLGYLDDAYVINTAWKKAQDEISSYMNKIKLNSSLT